ncbi:MAG: hypothetical protein M1831_005949 [Alyxoria varia]|nr:MAG: hypothetical protein M1831_005949 [Alyxoria varia]
MCLVGTVVIVLHAPPDKDIESINTMLDYALRPGFLIYCAIVGIFASAMIYRVAPRYGRKNPLVYLSICSTVGSISIMAIKAFGIALKLTLRGDNQFTHASTYVFLIVVAVCIVTQMNYFNKALSQFSTNVVNPLYYVLFTSATILASLILFGGFNTTDAVNTISLLCGFLVIFTGVYLLNMCRDTSSSNSESSGPGSRDGDTEEASKYLFDVDGVPTDGLAGLQTRRSMQLRRSMESANGGHYRSSSGSLSFARGESHRLMQDYAREEGGGAGSGRLDGSTNPSPGAAQQASAGGPFGRWSNRRRTLSRDHYDLDDLAEDPETEDEEAKALATPTNALSEDGDADRNGNGNGNGGATTKRTSFEGMGKGGGVNSTTTALS